MVASLLAAAALSVIAPSPVYQQWADQSKVPVPPGAVSVVYSTRCPSACTDGVDTIWLGTGADRWPSVRLYGVPFGTTGFVDQRRIAFLHELGHIFDERMLTVADRLAFDRIVRLARDWTAPPDAPADLFAQSYALASINGSRPKGPLNTIWYGFDPSRAQLAQIVGLIRAAAARPG